MQFSSLHVRMSRPGLENFTVIVDVLQLSKPESIFGLESESMETMESIEVDWWSFDMFASKHIKSKGPRKQCG